MRYLFPVIPFLPIMFAMTVEDLIERFKYLDKNIFKYLCQFVIYISVFVNIILILLTIILPASKEVALWQNCFSKNISSESVLLTYDPDGSGSTTGELELDFYNVNNIPVISIGDEAEIFMKKI